VQAVHRQTFPDAFPGAFVIKFFVIKFFSRLPLALMAVLVAGTLSGCGRSEPETAMREPAGEEARSGIAAGNSDSDPASDTATADAEPMVVQSEGTSKSDDAAEAESAEPTDDANTPPTGRLLPSPPPRESADAKSTETMSVETDEGTVATAEGAGGDRVTPDQKTPNAEDDPAQDTADASAWQREKPLPEELASKAFAAPPGARSLSESSRLWIDPQLKRVYVDGYVTLRRGPLEMFACPVGTKEHESIVAALAKSSEVHAALLAIGATPGTPVRFRPEFAPPTGQVIRIWVCWYDQDGKYQAVDARQWIMENETQEAMEAEWVFAGSGFWEDPEDNREYYRADSGDMICVSNFSTAMLDVTISSSADADLLRFAPFTPRIPPRETPVRLVLVPVPLPSDDPQAEADPNRLNLPKQTILPQATMPTAAAEGDSAP